MLPIILQLSLLSPVAYEQISSSDRLCAAAPAGGSSFRATFEETPALRVTRDVYHCSPRLNFLPCFVVIRSHRQLFLISALFVDVCRDGWSSDHRSSSITDALNMRSARLKQTSSLFCTM